MPCSRSTPQRGISRGIQRGQGAVSLLHFAVSRLGTRAGDTARMQRGCRRGASAQRAPHGQRGGESLRATLRYPLRCILRRGILRLRAALMRRIRRYSRRVRRRGTAAGYSRGVRPRGTAAGYSRGVRRRGTAAGYGGGVRPRGTAAAANTGCPRYGPRMPPPDPAALLAHVELVPTLPGRTADSPY